MRVCVNLTHSEHGLFVEADGDGTLAEIGHDDMPDEIRQSLYKFTRQVAQSNEPLIENDSAKLPDSSNLVNLAAMPVTLHSTLKGVILVANKRDAKYTDEDTELLLAIGRHAGIGDGKSAFAFGTGRGLSIDDFGSGRCHRSQRRLYARPLRKRGAPGGRCGAAA